MPGLLAQLRNAARRLGIKSSHQRRIHRVYDRHQAAMEAAVEEWLQLCREAIQYGIDHQLIAGEKPVITGTDTDYVPRTPLEKRLLEVRADAIAQELADRILVRKDEPDPTRYIVDWRCLAVEGDRRVGTAASKAFADALAAKGHATLSVGFDVVNRKAVEWAALHSSQLVTRINEATREALREAISRGIENGDSMYTVGKTIRPLIGLDAPRARALDKYRQSLADDPEAEAKVERRAAKLNRQRAITIARTETISAAAEGSIANYREMGFDSVIFEAAADACPDCLEEDGKEYPLAEAEGMIPVHPRCRCSWSPGEMSADAMDEAAVSPEPPDSPDGETPPEDQPEPEGGYKRWTPDPGDELSDTGMETDLTEHYRPWTDSRTEADTAAFDAYRSDTGSETINAYLRTGAAPEDSEWDAAGIAGLAERLARNIEEAPGLPAATVLYRGADMGKDFDPSRLVGTTTTDKGLMSTSLRPQVAEGFLGHRPSAAGGRRVMWEIEAPKGTKGVYLGTDPKDPFSGPGEKEFLLPAGTSMRVDAAKYDPAADVWRMRARVVPAVEPMPVERIPMPFAGLTPDERMAALKAGPGLGGSTGAVLSSYEEMGSRYVVKMGDTPGHAASELLANRLYDRLGVSVPQSYAVAKDGKVGLATLFEEDAKPLADVIDTDAGGAVREQLKKGFVADAWLGNWDVAGADFDNVLVDKEGRAIRIDNGGSLLYRARGASKDFPAEVSELSTLRDGARNPSAARLFGDITDKEIIEQSRALAGTMTDDTIRRLVDGAEGMTEGTKRRLTDSLISRRDWLTQHADDLAKPKPKVPKIDVKVPPEPLKDIKPNWDGMYWSRREMEDRFKELAARERMPVEEFRGKLNEVLDKQLVKNDKLRIWVRVQDDKMEKVIDSGRFKTQFETGTSQGCNDPATRARAESALFSYPKGVDGIPKSKRPVYGYLSDGDDGQDGNPSQYGTVRVRLKREVLERTTFTRDDSLGREFIPTPVLAPDPLVMVGGWRNTRTLAGASRPVSEWTRELGSPYFEAQAHHGVSVKDIEEVVFEKHPSPELQKKMIASGVKWRIMTS